MRGADVWVSGRIDCPLSPHPHGQAGSLGWLVAECPPGGFPHTFGSIWDKAFLCQTPCFLLIILVSCSLRNSEASHCGRRCFSWGPQTFRPPRRRQRSSNSNLSRPLQQPDSMLRSGREGPHACSTEGVLGRRAAVTLTEAHPDPRKTKSKLKAENVESIPHKNDGIQAPRISEERQPLFRNRSILIKERKKANFKETKKLIKELYNCGVKMFQVLYTLKKLIVHWTFKSCDNCLF